VEKVGKKELKEQGKIDPQEEEFGNTIHAGSRLPTMGGCQIGVATQRLKSGKQKEALGAA